VGKYLIRPLLSLEWLILDEKQAKACYRKKAKEVEPMDCLEFITRVTSPIFLIRVRSRCVITDCMPMLIGASSKRQAWGFPLSGYSRTISNPCHPRAGPR